MPIHSTQIKKNKPHAVAHALTQKQQNANAAFQFTDNRSVAIAQRKLQSIVQRNSNEEKVIQQQKNVSNSSSIPQFETIQLVNKAKGAAIGGLVGAAGYTALALANSWNPLGWGMLAAAGAGALAGGILGRSETPAPRAPRTMREQFHYNSEDLSDESGLSDGSDVEQVVRAPGKHDERRFMAGVYSPPRAVRRTARSIRRMRDGRASESDLAPILTRVGSTTLEMAPTSWRRDVGVYPTEPVPGGGRRRVGSAVPYEDSGKELDRDRAAGGHTQADMDEALRERLMGSPRGSSRRRTRSPAERRRLDEASGILMSDMARGSRGSELVDEMLEQPASFRERFTDKTGTYRPSHKKGGSQHIQEETRRRKKRDASDSDTENESDVE